MEIRIRLCNCLTCTGCKLLSGALDVEAFVETGSDDELVREREAIPA